jgi:hypothetical protein
MKKQELQVVYKKASELIPYINNTRTHSEEQVKQIAAAINEWGFTNPILIDEKNSIIAGHGRLLAAQKIGMQEVPTIELKGLNDTQRKAYIIADNKLALNAGWDEELLKLELQELKELDFDIELTGFSLEELEENNSEDNNKNEIYTAKIESPIYEPNDKNILLNELFDDSKAKKIIEDIKKSNLSQEEKNFLTLAAYRHVVFNFKNIADFYPNQNPEMQDLIECSALVIIDFNKAIEKGFVTLTKNFKKGFINEYNSGEEIEGDEDE